MVVGSSWQDFGWICINRVHVTSSAKFPTYQFSNSKFFENQIAWASSLEVQKISPWLIRVCWTRWVQPFFVIGIFVTSPQEFWTPERTPVCWEMFKEARCWWSKWPYYGRHNRHRHFKLVTITYRLKYKKVIQAGISFELFSLELTAFWSDK